MMQEGDKNSELIGGKYVLEKLIGEGATGEVWQARHTTLKSKVAIKFLHGASAFKDSRRKRFLQEARVAARLNTRHAVKVFDFGFTHAGRPFLIMEFLDGEPLSSVLRREGRLTPEFTARIMRHAARALDKAHALGVVHRDFKPDNIYLVKSDDEVDVKVVDFGVAKLIGQLGEEEGEDGEKFEDESGSFATSSVNDWKNMSLTKTGRAVGTPCYMAPEQTRTEKVIGPEVDIWAMGVVTYECLVGNRPFDAKNVIELFTRIVTMRYRKAHEIDPSIPEAFDDWFRKACAVEPADRFATASEAAKQLVTSLGLDDVIGSLGETQGARLWDSTSVSAAPRKDTPKAPRVSDVPETTSSVPGAVSQSGEVLQRKSISTQMIAFVGSALLVMSLVAVYWELRGSSDGSHGVSNATSAASSTFDAVSSGSVSTVVSASSSVQETNEVDRPAASVSASAVPTRTNVSRPTRRRPSWAGHRSGSGHVSHKTKPPATTAEPLPKKEATPKATATSKKDTTPRKPSAFDLPDLGL